MGVKYFAKAAQRLAPAGQPQLRPAMPSRSPLAEADQRLNFDTFAEHLYSPVPTAEPVEQDLSDIEQPLGPLRAPRAQTPESHKSEPRSERVREELPAIQSRQELRPERPLQPVVPAEQALHGRMEEPLPLPAREGSAVRPELRDRPSTPRAVEEPQDSTRPLMVSETQTTIAPQTRREPISAEAAPSDAVVDALNRAMAWVARAPQQTNRQQEANTSRVLEPRRGPMPLDTQTRRPAAPVVRESRPVTHLEIGKIEVEIVAPEKPSRDRSTQRQRPSRPPAATAAPRPGFGWRQR